MNDIYKCHNYKIFQLDPVTSNANHALGLEQGD